MHPFESVAKAIVVRKSLAVRHAGSIPARGTISRSKHEVY